MDNEFRGCRVGDERARVKPLGEILLHCSSSLIATPKHVEDGVNRKVLIIFPFENIPSTC